jgi:glycosyltransferase involved in cell wall biosynthesis
MNEVVLLIPHFNSPQALKSSIESIDASEKIDIVIVDDGSKKHKIEEATLSSSFKANGSIIYLYLKDNLGIESALNYGLDYIKEQKQYHYIARLDCGDICLGKRFQKQASFLKSNPEIKLVGSNGFAVLPDGKFLYNLVYPENHDAIKNRMYVNSMFLHPCVMFASEVIDVVGKYPTNYKAAEDYAFFFKIVKEFKTANIQEFLLQYEINPSGISLSKRKLQVWSRIRIIKDNFYFGFWPIYGLLRNLILYFFPNSIIQKIKEIKDR